MSEDSSEVIQARLASRLGHSSPTVSETVRRLVEEGLVTRSGRALALTAKGRKQAESVIRKHRLAERLLTDVIGVGWHKAHLEAGRWEHVISDEVEQRLVVLLDNPATCPHGNPIPGSGHARKDLRPLEQAKAGQHVRLERISEAVEFDEAALSYLADHGFRPGSQACVRERVPDGTLVLELGGGTIAIGPSLGRQLFVTLLAG